MLDKYGSAVSVLKPLEDESLQRLKEERRESLALLPSQSSVKPKTEADLLQDKQRLSLQLQQAQKHLEVRFKQGEFGLFVTFNFWMYTIWPNVWTFPNYYHQVGSTHILYRMLMHYNFPSLQLRGANLFLHDNMSMYEASSM